MVCCCSMVGTKACDTCGNKQNVFSRGYYEFKPMQSEVVTVNLDELKGKGDVKSFSDKELLDYAMSKLGCSRETLVEWYKINNKMVDK